MPEERTAKSPSAPREERNREYNQIVTLLDSLIDEVGEDEFHPLASLMEVLSVLIENYEADHVPELTIE